MSKPTLFFSHSSKDKDMILAIKNKVMQYTSGTLEIFQSSDGESIPFGTNWIHKVEEGLKEAKVMFVFVTEKSISTGWIYFEAGYAYSKGVHVIPVGIGVSVGDLKAPLNLLQGFNITSADSLNNFLTIINREFNYCFPAQFTDDDFNEIVSYSGDVQATTDNFDTIVRSIGYEIYDETTDTNGQRYQYDLAKYFNKIVDYLDANSIQYFLADPYQENCRKCLVAQGIKLIFDERSEPNQSINGRPARKGKIVVRVSPLNFEKSFELYLKLTELLEEKEVFYIRIYLNDGFTFTTVEEDITALLSNVPEWCSCVKDYVGLYDCPSLNLRFRIVNRKAYSYREEPEYVLHILYNPKNTSAKNIVSLVSKLYELGLILNMWAEAKHV